MLEYISSTTDLWTAKNESFMGMTTHCFCFAMHEGGRDDTDVGVKLYLKEVLSIKQHAQGTISHF